MENPTAPVSIEGRIWEDARAVQLDKKHVVPIGKANVTAPNGLQLTDDVGLPCDPRYYAKSDCSSCYGRGTFSTSRTMTRLDADKMFGNQLQAQVEKEWESKNIDIKDEANKKAMIREFNKRLDKLAKTNKTCTNVLCHCAQGRYVKAHGFVVKENERLGIKPEQAETKVEPSPEQQLLTTLVDKAVSKRAQDTVLHTLLDGSVQ